MAKILHFLTERPIQYYILEYSFGLTANYRKDLSESVNIDRERSKGGIKKTLQKELEYVQWKLDTAPNNLNPSKDIIQKPLGCDNDCKEDWCNRKDNSKFKCNENCLCRSPAVSIFSSLWLLTTSLFLLLSCSITNAHEPEDIVIVNGSRAYQCFYDGVNEFEWLLNSTRINTLNITSYSLANHPPYGFLIFSQIPLVLNNTDIQCNGIFPNNERLVIFRTILYVQGVLPPVLNLDYFLKNGILIISWDAPFFLSLPDDFKTYCVEVYNHLTGASQDVECGIDSTIHTLTSNLKNLSCGEYSIKIIAQNIVGNSTPSSIRIWNRDLNFSKIVVSSVNFTNQKIIQFVMEVDICFPHTMLMASNGENFQNSGNDRSDIFQCMLEEDQFFDVWLTFNYLSLNSSSSRENISTHDVAYTEIMTTKLLKYYIQSFFVLNSKAAGVLYAVLHVDNDGNKNFSNSMYFPVSQKNAMQGIVKDIPNGTYRLISYDIESNGFLRRESFPAYTNMFEVTNNDYRDIVSNNQDNNNCKVKQNEIICYCNENHQYQIILQEMGSNDIIRSYVSHCSTNVTFNETDGKYFAVIFYGNGSKSITNKSVYYSTELIIDSNVSTSVPDRSNEDIIVPSVFLAVIGFIIFVIFEIIICLVVYRKKNWTSYIVNPTNEKKSSNKKDLLSYSDENHKHRAQNNIYEPTMV